jgi:hypothetical protein
MSKGVIIAIIGGALLLYMLARRAPAAAPVPAAQQYPRPDELAAAVTLEELAATERMHAREVNQTLFTGLLSLAAENEAGRVQRASLQDTLYADLVGREAELSYSRDVALREMGAATLSNLAAADYAFRAERGAQNVMMAELASRERVSLSEALWASQNAAQANYYDHLGQLRQLETEAQMLDRVTRAGFTLGAMELEAQRALGIGGLEVGREVALTDIAARRETDLAGVAAQREVGLMTARNLPLLAERESATQIRLGELEYQAARDEYNAQIAAANIAAQVENNRIQAELAAIRSAEKTKRRGGLFGAITQIAGIALAPFTGGASLGLTAAGSRL